MPSIRRVLARSATRYAHRAVDAFLQEDFEDFYLTGGVAIEHAMKARLARENIAFIAPDKNFKSALALWRAQDDVTILATGTRTASGQEALDRVCALDPAFAGRHRDSVLQTLRFRNGEAHLGAAGSDEHRPVLVALIRALHDLLLVDPAEFWGKHQAFVESLVDESLTHTAQHVAEQIAAAKSRYDRTVGAIEPGARAALLEQFRRERDQRIADDAIAADCPACEGAGLLFGDFGVEMDVDVDHREGVIVSAHPYVVFVSETFECWACQLQLTDQDSLEAAGFELQAEPPSTFDTDAFLREYYADEG